MSKELVRVDHVPSFAVSLDEARKRLADFQQFIQEQMVEDEDYGVIPGTAKPTLYKPGAEKLANIFGFAPEFEEIRCVEDWDKPLFYFSYKCRLIDKRSGFPVAECVASCNSREEKYYWRYQERTCPKCGQSTVFKSKDEHGGYFCWRKRGGCGATFAEGDEAIESQSAGKVPNPDPFSLVNTFQKMAQKRALVGAVLIATRASGIFTQDVEDLAENAALTPADVAGGHAKPKKGKVAEDITTRFWAYAKAKDVEKSAKAVLEEEGGDFEKALIRVKELCGE